MTITKQINIDLLRHRIQEQVEVVQCDANTRAVAVTLMAGGTAWTPPDSFTASVAFKKPDGKTGWYDTLPNGGIACTISENTVTAILAPEALNVAGKVKVAVVFQDENLNQLATFPFWVAVSENPAAGNTISNDYWNYTNMTQINEAVEAALASLEESKEDFLAKAEEALQTVHDTATEDAPAILCEAAGEVISVADAADRPLKGLSIYGKTVQNGTPTPSAPVALESVGESIGVNICGTNLWDEEWEVGAIASSNGTSIPAAQQIRNKNYIPVIPNSNLYIVIPGGSQITGKFFDSGKNPIGSGWGINSTVSKAVTVPENACYLRFCMQPSYGMEYKNDISINYPATLTEYEPYKGQTLTAAAEGGLCGIGEVKDEIDFARGVRVQRVYEKVFDGTETLTSYASVTNGIIFRLNPYVKQGYTSFSKCSHFTFNTSGWNNQTNGQFKLVNPDYCVFRHDDYPTPDAFKAWLAQQYAAGTPVIVQYVLAEPIETPLSAEELAAFATLRTGKPNTTVFNDSGAEMKLGYVADTKLYIDQKIAAISAALLNT